MPLNTRHIACMRLTVAAAIALLPWIALADLPKRDWVVELRQVYEGKEMQDGLEESGGYAVSTAPSGAVFAPQQVRVRNGDKASLRLSQSMPMQWQQSASTQSASVSAGGANASNSASGVTQGLTWMEAGQNIVVTPRWLGGKQPVQLQLELQSDAVDERTSADLPTSTRQQLSTTVSAPLHLWVTIATSGGAARAGTYSSAGGADARRLLQIRVSPP